MLYLSMYLYLVFVADEHSQTISYYTIACISMIISMLRNTLFSVVLVLAGTKVSAERSKEQITRTVSDCSVRG